MKIYFAALALTATLAAGVPVRAHHSFAAVFDAQDPVDLTGTVTAVEWMNPHTWFYVDVESGDGQAENWGFEMGSPNGLIRRGWNRDSLQAGHVVRVIGSRAKDGSLRAAVRTVTLSTGETLFGAQDESR